MQTALFLYLEQCGADFLIVVKHSLHKGFQVIKDRLTYGRRVPLQTSKCELDHGRDITWTLRDMPNPEWVVENWPGSATVIAVRSKGIHDGKLTDETRYYVTSLRRAPWLCCGMCVTAGRSKTRCTCPAIPS